MLMNIRTLLVLMVALFIPALVSHGNLSGGAAISGGAGITGVGPDFSEDWEEGLNCNLLENSWTVSGAAETVCKNTDTPSIGLYDLYLVDDATVDTVTWNDPACSTSTSNCELRWHQVFSDSGEATPRTTVVMRSSDDTGLCSLSWKGSDNTVRANSRDNSTTLGSITDFPNGINFCLQYDLDGGTRGCRLLVDTGSTWCSGAKYNQNAVETSGALAVAKIVFSDASDTWAFVHFDSIEVWVGGGP